MRTPVIGDWDNPYDKTQLKSFDIIDDDGTIGYQTTCTEYMAELLWAGWWRITPLWLWWQEHPDEQYVGERQWVGDMAVPPFEPPESNPVAP